MITGTISPNSCGNKHMLPLIHIHPLVGTKVHGLISGSLIVKIHGVPKSLVLLKKHENID